MSPCPDPPSPRALRGTVFLDVGLSWLIPEPSHPWADFHALALSGPAGRTVVQGVAQA